MLINTDYVTPAEMTGYVRTAAADLPRNLFQLAQWLPSRLIDDLTYRFERGAGGLIDAATYRAYDAESPIGNRPGLTRVSGELPPISRKIRLGEYDRLRQRNADQANPSIRNALFSDGERLVRQIAARIEVARGAALANGVVTIVENGVNATVDFGRTGSHQVTAGVLWSDANSSTPLADMLSWQTTYVATNGVPPGAIVMSTVARNYLLANVAIRAMAATTAGTPAIVSLDTLRQVMDAYGLPPIYVNDEQVNVNGSATRIIPANYVLLLPAPGQSAGPDGTDLGATVFGTTAESLDPTFGLVAGAEPGLVAGVYRDEDPVALWTKAAAIAIPVVANPDLTLRATVA